MSQPILTSAIYDGTYVRAFWNYPGLPPSSFTLQTAPTSGSNPIYIQKNIGNNFGAVPITAPLSGPYQVQVAAVVNSSPVWSQGMLLLTTLPELVIANYDGKSVAVSWKPIPDAQPAISSWTIKVYVPTGGGEIYTITVDDPRALSAIIPIPTPLKSPSPTENYTVQVCANTSYGACTCLAPVTLNTALPLLSNAIYDGTGLQVFWTDAGTQQEPIIGFQVTILDSNRKTVLSFQKKESPPISYTLEIPVPLPPNKTFYVQVSNYTATKIYTSTEPTQFETALPIVTKALLEELSGKLTLQVNLDAIAYPAIAIAYSLIVSSPSIGLPYTTDLIGVYPTSGNVDVSKGWDPKNTYILQIVATSADGIIQTRSAPLNLLTALPTINSGQYDGNSVIANWSEPDTSSLPATAYEISVLDSAKKAVYSTIINDPNSSEGKINIPSTLLETASYFLQVFALSGTESQAAAAEISVLSALPKIIDYKITPNSLAISWDKIPDSFVPITFLTLALVNKKGEIIFSKPKVSPTLTEGTLIFPSLPDISIDLYAAIIADNSTNSSSISELVKVNILDWAPEITQVSFSSNVVSIEIKINPSSKENITGFEVDLYADGKFSGTTPINKFETSLILPLKPKAGVNYSVKIKAISNAHSISLESDENIILTSAGAIKAANYNGKVLTATWVQLLNPGVNGYLISVLNGEKTVASVYSSNNQAAIEVPLDSESPYSVVLQAIGNHAISQMGTPMTIVTNSTEIVSTNYNSSTKKLEIIFTAVPQATLYNTQLYQRQKLVDVAPTYSGQKATFDVTLDPQSSYQAVVTTANGAATGPESQRANIISSAPLITSVSNTNSMIKTDWTSILDENISGYLVTLFNKAGAIATSEANYTGTNSIIIGNALTGDAPFSAQVQAISDTGQGPLSLPAIIIGDGLMIDTLSYSGKSVTGNWSNSLEDAVAGYLMSVRDGNSIIAQVASAGSTATVEALLDPAKSYTLEVQPTGLNSLGPVMGGPNIFTLVTQVKSIVYDDKAKTLTIEWNPVTGATAFVTKLIQDDIEVNVVPTYTKNKAVFTGVLNSWENYQVIVQAQMAIATGPPSLPANAIVASPQIYSVKNINNQVTIDWTPLIEESISGYLVTLFNKSGAIATTEANYTETNSILLDNPLTGDAPYTTQVQAVSDKGIGPLSQAATIIGGGLMINTLSYDGQSVTGNWTNSKETGVTAYNIYVRDGDSVIAQVASSGSSATVDALLDPDKSYTLEVQPTGLNSSGPIIGGPDIFTAQTQIKSIVYDNIANTLTVEWNPVTNATSFVAKFYADDIEVNITPTYNTNKAVFAEELNSWENYHVIVEAKMAIATGPPSYPADVITAGPLITNVTNIENTVSVEWEELVGGNYSGYLVILTNSTTPDVKTYYTESTLFSVSNVVTGTDSWKVQVQVINNKAIGPFNKNVAYRDIITQKATITNAKYDGQSLIVSWNGLPIPIIGYYLNIYNSYEIIHSTISSGTNMAIPVTLNPNETYTALMQAAGENSSGPLGDSVQLIAESPVIETITYDNNQLLTVTWGAANWASSFVLHLYNEDIKITKFSPSYSGKISGSGTIILDQTKVYNVRVEGIKGKITGPLSAPELVITAEPKMTSTSYQSGNVLASWNGINQDVVNGYNIGIFTAGNNTPIAQNAVPVNEGTVATTLTEGTTYEVKIQAIGNKTIGPWSPSMNPWQIDSGYYFSEYKDDIQPYLFRAQNVPPSPNTAFELYLPQIFNKQPNPLPLGLTAPTNPNSPFVMSVNVADKTLPYKISVSKEATNDAWNFTQNGLAIRTELSDDYNAFITALSGVDKGMLPGTIPYLNQLIARGLPLTYAETLFYSYGFNPSKRYVSLQAGMRITLSYSEYQFIGPGGTSPLLNGYVGSGSVSYVMGSYLSGSDQGTQKLDIGFSNFLNQLAIETHSNVGGGSSVLDTYITGASEPYYRIFYPTSFLSADEAGSLNPSQNISIVVSSDFAKMKAATDAWNNGQPFPGDVLVTFLRGRATVVPEIKITVSGQEQWVPIGTTLRNILDEFAAVPFRPATGSIDGWQTTNIQLSRTVDSVINKTTEVETAYSVGRSNPIAISHAKIVCYTNGQDNFDLPLMQGDTINLINQD
ncbi:MAG: hypothetical protein ACI83B_000207 [Sediminicola sp.]|jgi:hypothetical protein